MFTFILPILTFEMFLLVANCTAATKICLWYPLVLTHSILPKVIVPSYCEQTIKIYTLHFMDYKICFQCSKICSCLGKSQKPQKLNLAEIPHNRVGSSESQEAFFTWQESIKLLNSFGEYLYVKHVWISPSMTNDLVPISLLQCSASPKFDLSFSIFPENDKWPCHNFAIIMLCQMARLTFDLIFIQFILQFWHSLRNKILDLLNNVY